MRLTTALVLSTAFALSACSGGGQSDDSAQSGSAGAGASEEVASVAEASPAQSGPSLANAPAAFSQCSTCHTIKPGVHGVGPSLFGIYGAKAGSVSGYSYSPALKASGKTWDDAALDAWLAQPMKDVPGTRMTYAGLADAAKRKELIAYLKTLK